MRMIMRQTDHRVPCSLFGGWFSRSLSWSLSSERFDNETGDALDMWGRSFSGAPYSCGWIRHASHATSWGGRA